MDEIILLFDIENQDKHQNVDLLITHAASVFYREMSPCPVVPIYLIRYTCRPYILKHTLWLFKAVISKHIHISKHELLSINMETLVISNKTRFFQHIHRYIMHQIMWVPIEALVFSKSTFLQHIYNTIYMKSSQYTYTPRIAQNIMSLIPFVVFYAVV